METHSRLCPSTADVVAFGQLRPGRKQYLHSRPLVAHAWPMDVDLSAMAAGGSSRRAPPVAGLVGVVFVCRTGEGLRVLIEHPRDDLHPRRQQSGNVPINVEIRGPTSPRSSYSRSLPRVSSVPSPRPVGLRNPRGSLRASGHPIGPAAHPLLVDPVERVGQLGKVTIAVDAAEALLRHQRSRGGPSQANQRVPQVLDVPRDPCDRGVH